MFSQVYSNHKWDSASQQTDIWTDNHLANYFVEWLKKQDDKEVSLVCQFVRETGKNEEIPLIKAIKTVFPNKFVKSTRTKKSQMLLKMCVQNMFGGENTLILEDYIHPDVDLELDYFLPEYKLAFEYQVKRIDLCEVNINRENNTIIVDIIIEKNQLKM